MGSPQANYNDQPQEQKAQYFLNEEESRVFKQCLSESFWYRCLPFSAGAMFATQALISKGYLTSSTRFGSLPKLAFAGFFGFMVGRVSYVNTCKERLMALENSPLAAKLREEKYSKAHGFRPPPSKPASPEQGFPASPPPVQSYAAPKPEYKSRAVEVPFSSTMSESSTTGITDGLALEPEIQQEEPAKAPPVTYEELRRKNRGVYDVLSPQTPARPAPTKEAKKNQYGDVWED